MIPPKYLELLNYEPRLPKEKKMQQPTVSQRIGDTNVALNCIQACVIQLRESGSPIAAEDLAFSVGLLTAHAKAEGKKLNNSALARMAGNIAAGIVAPADYDLAFAITSPRLRKIAATSVFLARQIAKELEK